MNIEVNKAQDVVCEAGNVYICNKRTGIYFCFEDLENMDSGLSFVNLIDGTEYSFTLTDMQQLVLKGKILNIETSL